MSDPSLIALFGYDLGVYARSVTSGSEIWVDRVQRFEPTQEFRTNPYYELGRKDKIGVTQDPPSYRVVVEQNMTASELDFLLAGKIPNPGGAQSYTAGDLLGKNTNLYVVMRNTAGVIDKELEVTQLRIAEVQFKFSVRDAIMQTWTLEGIGSKLYTSGFPHSTWGTPDTTSPGGIHGKEARIWFTSGSLPTTREFRLQQFTARAAFPVEQVKELGRRTIVGTMSDVPDVSLEFDVLVSDDQPMDKLYQSSGSGWDLDQPSAFFTTFIRVFDPDAAEGVNVLKMFKLENCRVIGSTPTRAQVRGLATARYRMTVAKVTTVDSGGMIVSNTNDLV